MAKAKNDEKSTPLEITPKLTKGPKTLPKIGQGTPKSAKGVANTVPNDVWGGHLGTKIYEKCEEIMISKPFFTGSVFGAILGDAKVQRYKGTKVQRYKGTKVQTNKSHG